MKYIKAIVLSMVILFSFESDTSAYEATPAHIGICFSGGEAWGYVVNCEAPYGHAGTSYIPFQDNLIPATYKSYVDTAVVRWNSTGIVNITRVISSVNKITTYVDPNDDSNASVSSSVDPFTGHKLSWAMKFNTSHMGPRTAALNQATATHEFGHSIGLGHVLSASNKNKIML